jgi:hypothetical protein
MFIVNLCYKLIKFLILSFIDFVVVLKRTGLFVDDDDAVAA